MSNDPSTPPSGANAAGEPSSTEPQGGAATPQATNQVLWGDDAPAYLRGKNRDQTLQFINQMAQGVQQLAAQQRQAAAQAAAANVRLPDMPDASKAYDDPEAWQQAVLQRARAESQLMLNQAAMPVLQQANETAKALSKLDHKDVWDAYGHEIEATLSALPPNVPRSKQLYDEAVALVRGKHADEIADAKAQAIAERKLAEMGATASATNTISTGQRTINTNDSVWNKFEQSDFGKNLLATVGKAGILRAVETAGWDLNEYAEQVAANKSSFHPNRKGVWNNKNLGAKNA